MSDGVDYDDAPATGGTGRGRAGETPNDGDGGAGFGERVQAIVIGMLLSVVVAFNTTIIGMLQSAYAAIATIPKTFEDALVNAGAGVTETALGAVDGLQAPLVDLAGSGLAAPLAVTLVYAGIAAATIAVILGIRRVLLWVT